MSSLNVLLALGTSTRSPFIVQKCIEQLALEAEESCSQYRLLSPEIDTHIKNMWRSHNAMYGLCDFHVDTLYLEKLGKSSWWARRKLRKIEKQWKIGMWLTLDNEADQFIIEHGASA